MKFGSCMRVPGAFFRITLFLVGLGELARANFVFVAGRIEQRQSCTSTGVAAALVEVHARVPPFEL